MVNGMDVDDNVGRIIIDLNFGNKWDSEIMRMMINRYSNLYGIIVYDKNYLVDDMMYGLIK